MNFLGMGPGELMVLMVIALIVFGPGKLPEIGQGMGKAIREFRKATSHITDEFTRELSLDAPLQEPRRAASPPPQATQQASASVVPAAPVVTEEAPASVAPAAPVVTEEAPASVAPAAPVVTEEKPPLILEIKRPVAKRAASTAAQAQAGPESGQTMPVESTVPVAASVTNRAQQHRKSRKSGVVEASASEAASTGVPTNG